MKRTQQIFILLLVFLALASCSRKKNTFLTRNSHAIATEYNTLYNGGIAFDAGKEELTLTYRDNFWEILPVERIELKDEVGLPGEATNQNFNRSEEKAIKAISKHSMYIDGEEYNPQIDEAYLLLGKARYFDERFVPALDAFNYILDRFATGNNINNAKVWKAKTNIRLRNEEVALRNLMEMLETADLDDNDIANASSIMAQAYINLDSLPQALPLIKTASEKVSDNELKGRYAYIKGQLYNRLGYKDSANIAFDEVIALNRKSPRVYMINSYIAKAKNFDYDKEDRIAFLGLLEELEANRENRPFLDKIYNQIGDYYRNNDSTSTAIDYYNKSIKAYRDDKYLQSMNYQTLAEINFENALYKQAGAYYDSTLTNLDEIGRQYRVIKKKRVNLDDVIKYEDIATANDSVIRLVNMNEGERLTYFTDYTNKLKLQAEKDSIAAISYEKSVGNNEFFKKNKNVSFTKEDSKPGNFYFYNSTTVAYGKIQFEKVWGDRELRDNWRLSATQQSGINNDIVDADIDTKIEDNAKFSPQTYISQIPTDQKVIDSLAKDRNFAYYQLGLIYKEKFKEYDLAANRLEKLLQNDPEERLILPAKYNLYKIYELQGKEPLAAKYKNDIINNHSDSRYAEILLNPNTALATDESSPEFKYKAVYKQFENSQYEMVIETTDDYITLYNGTDIVPKLEMLKATAMARRDGFEAYKEALNYISLNYPNSEEGKEAQDIYKNVLPTLKNNKFLEDDAAKKYNLAYKFDVTNREAAQKLQQTIDKTIADQNYRDFTTSIDYYDPNSVLLVVHGINSREVAKNFGQNLKDNKQSKVQKPYFEISSENYKIVQLHKNLDTYLSDLQ